MILAIIKAAAALFAGVLAISAVLMGLASGLARNTTDPVERKDATITAFWSLIVFALCAGAIVSLSGCSGRYEGAGFTNTGRPAPHLCRQVDERGNEKWFNCQENSNGFR